MSQEFMVNEKIGGPLKSTKLAGILNSLFIEKMDMEKLKKLIKTYNKLEKCPNMLAPICNEEIGRGRGRSYYLVLQKIQVNTVKAACAITDAY